MVAQFVAGKRWAPSTHTASIMQTKLHTETELPESHIVLHPTLSFFCGGGEGKGQ